MQIKTTTFDIETANVIVVLDDGRSWTGLVTPSARDGAPSIDCWMSSSLIALCEEIPEAPEYGVPMADVLLDAAKTHLAA